MIEGRIEGVYYRIYFYNCTDNTDCRTIQFRTAFDLTNGFPLSQINEWNKNKLFGKAWLDDENDPVLEMPVNIDYGVTAKNLEDTFDYWRVTVSQFKEHIDY